MKRTTINAIAGLEKHTAALDAQSAVALEFATFWTSKHLGLRPAPGVVIRRALQLLAGHLSRLEEPQLRAEGRAFEEASRGKGTARSLTEARARIEDHRDAPGRQPMDDWRDALYSVAERAEQRRMIEALAAHLDLAGAEE